MTGIFGQPLSLCRSVDLPLEVFQVQLHPYPQDKYQVELPGKHRELQGCEFQTSPLSSFPSRLLAQVYCWPEFQEAVFTTKLMMVLKHALIQ